MKILFNGMPLNEQSQPIKSLSTNGKNLLALNYAVNASSAIIEHCGNFISELEFEIERAHASENEALAFTFNHYHSLNSVKSASLILQDESTQKVLLEIPNAILSSIKINLLPLSTKTKYEFTGLTK